VEGGNVLSTGLDFFTPAARRHIARMLRAIAPQASRLERQFRASLAGLGYDRARRRALLAITPAVASRARSLPAFLEDLDKRGRSLAQLNVSPAELREALAAFAELAEGALEGRFAPAREQLHFATVLALNRAYYRVREAETQAFFGLELAEREADGMEDLLRRFLRVLLRAVGARAGRLLLAGRGETAKTGRPRYIERGSADERLVASDLRGRWRSYWSYPLGPAAVVQLGFSSPRPWFPREMALFEAAAQRCREAGTRRRLEEEIRRLDAEARRAEEEERRRIGRELHDEAGQSLLLLRLELEMIERDAPAPLRRRLRKVRGIAEHTVAELRRIIAALSPAVLERVGLEAALRHLAARFQRVHPSEVRVALPGAGFRIPPEAQQVIYRVAQEALHNIAKHSGATRVNLSVRGADKVIRLRVSDNGAGFSTEMVRSRPMSFGLTGMRERAELLGGRLRVTSAPGKGATVALDLPLSAAPVASDGKNTRIID
jgi:signal transduction histidine kinase